MNTKQQTHFLDFSPMLPTTRRWMNPSFPFPSLHHQHLQVTILIYARSLVYLETTKSTQITLLFPWFTCLPSLHHTRKPGNLHKPSFSPHNGKKLSALNRRRLSECPVLPFPLIETVISSAQRQSMVLSRKSCSRLYNRPYPIFRISIDCLATPANAACTIP